MELSNLVYMDYQASTPMDPRVKHALVEALDVIGNPHSSEHAAGWKAAAALDAARERVARALEVDPDEVVFTSGATESNNFALAGSCMAPQGGRNVILLPETEHKCTLEAARAAKRWGFEASFLRVLEDGSLDLDYLASALTDRVALVSVMAVHNEIGTVQPIPEITRLAHEAGALVHSDAVQLLSLADANSLVADVDFLSFSAHKVYGPKGIGLSIVKRDAQKRVGALLRGGGQQAGLRSGTVPVPLSLALAEAIELMMSADADLERIRISALQKAIWERLQGSAYEVVMNGAPLHRRHPGNLNLAFPGFAAQDVISLVQPRLAISSGSACSSGTMEPSHVLQALHLPRAITESSIRIGFGRFTTDADVEGAVDLLLEALGKMRALEA